MISPRGRARLILHRRLSMSNLFENLAEAFGEAVALEFPNPLFPSLFPRREVTFGEALRFTNLAAETLIRELDLLKGERVSVLCGEKGLALLLTAAVIKAGGIAVPLELPISEEKYSSLFRGCGVTAGMASADAFDAPAPEPPLFPDRQGIRWMFLGNVPAGRAGLVLDDVVSSSSGFFLPYTLKPTSVVCLSDPGVEGWGTRWVMATNRGLLHPARCLSGSLPVGPGERCLFSLHADRSSSLAAAVLALCAGLRLTFPRTGAVADMVDRAGEQRPAALWASAEQLHSAAGLPDAPSSFSSVRLWMVQGRLGDRGLELVRECAARRRAGKGRVFLLEFLSLRETAPLCAFRLTLPGPAGEVRTPFLAIPTNRVKASREKGSPDSSGGRSELLVRGPSVTPGYWNDLETSLRSWEAGWFTTGIPVPAPPSGGRKGRKKTFPFRVPEACTE